MTQQKPPPRRIKILKKGKRKTPREIDVEYRSATIQMIRSFVRKEPDEARKIFSEMLNSVV